MFGRIESIRGMYNNCLFSNPEQFRRKIAGSSSLGSLDALRVCGLYSLRNHPTEDIKLRCTFLKYRKTQCICVRCLYTLSHRSSICYVSLRKIIYNRSTRISSRVQTIRGDNTVFKLPLLRFLRSIYQYSVCPNQESNH